MNGEVYGCVLLVNDKGSVSHVCTTPTAAELNGLMFQATGYDPDWSGRVTRYEFVSTMLEHCGRLASDYDYETFCTDVLGVGTNTFEDVKSNQLDVVLEASNTHTFVTSNDGSTEQWLKNSYGADQDDIYE